MNPGNGAKPSQEREVIKLGRRRTCLKGERVLTLNSDLSQPTANQPVSQRRGAGWPGCPVLHRQEQPAGKGAEDHGAAGDERVR